MDLSAILKSYADEIGGQYSEYDSSNSIVIVPVSGGRFQTVLGTVKQNELYNRKLIVIHSKVCPIRPGMDYQMLMEQVSFFNYCRFIIRDNYLQVEAVAALSNISVESIKEMVQEVANLSDQYELKLTGTDIY